MVFSNRKSSSCWIDNRASVATDAGAALLIEGTGQVDFGTASHNFGSNKAGPPGGVDEQDVVVFDRGRDKGWYKCKTKAGAGSYQVEGNICAATSSSSSCICPIAQVFDTSKCSCQRRV
jgi:hypothetical protein